MEVNILEKILDNSVVDFPKYNTKVKSYRDGSCTVTYCNHMIFNPQIQSACYSDDDLNSLLASDIGRIKKDLKIKSYGENCFPKDNERLRNDSLKRAVDKVYDICFQNDWSYFVTCTLSEDNDFSRFSGADVINPFANWLHNRTKRDDLQYIFVPELHKKGGIHLHGLINDSLELFDSERHLYGGKAWKNSDLLERGVDLDNYKVIYNIPSWKYGWSTAIPLSGTPAAVACYMTKYMTKDCKKIFGKYYLSSRNIRRDTDIYYSNTDLFDEINQQSSFKGGNRYKYDSDFKFKCDDRNPTDEILKFLSERNVV